MLKSNKIRLRPLENEDLDFLFVLENDQSIWSVSGTTAKFSKETLRNYIRNAKQDIVVSGQFRFVIDLEGIAIGCIDLFKYNWEKSEAEVGIALLKEYRGKGYAKKSLRLLTIHAFEKLSINNLYSTILPENHISITLFKQVGFSHIDKNKYHLCK